MLRIALAWLVLTVTCAVDKNTARTKLKSSTFQTISSMDQAKTTKLEALLLMSAVNGETWRID